VRRKEIRDPLPSASKFRLTSITFLMLSALALRLPLRHNVLSRAALLSKIMMVSQSRSLTAIPLAEEERHGKPHHPPEMRKDVTWNLLADYSHKRVAPKRTPEEIWRDRSSRLEANPPLSIYSGSLLSCPRVFALSNRFLGRSVVVKSDNLTGAIKSLTNRLKANKVLQTWKYQMRHEKKGVKRRRLESQRWRRRFADEVCPFFNIRWQLQSDEPADQEEDSISAIDPASWTMTAFVSSCIASVSHLSLSI